MFWGCCSYVEMILLVEETVNLNHGAYIELLDNQVLPLLMILLRNITLLSLYPKMTILTFKGLQM